MNKTKKLKTKRRNKTPECQAEPQKNQQTSIEKQILDSNIAKIIQQANIVQISTKEQNKFKFSFSSYCKKMKKYFTDCFKTKQQQIGENEIQQYNQKFDFIPLLGPQRLMDKVFYYQFIAKGKKTLILDLDETLIHSELNPQSVPDYKFEIIVNTEEKQQIQFFVNVRQGTQNFIKDMSNYYEVVTFTAALKQYSDQILDYIDPLKRVAYQLSRKQCIKLAQGKGYHKDLSKLGRDLKDIIIIDNTPQCFELQPENGIQILPFYDDPNDKELIYISSFLKFLSLVNDVRPIDNYIDKFVNEENIIYLDKNLQKQVYLKILGKNLDLNNNKNENTTFLNSPKSEDYLLTLQREINDIKQIGNANQNLSDRISEKDETIQQDLKEVNHSQDEISKIESFSQIQQQNPPQNKIEPVIEKHDQNIQISMVNRGADIPNNLKKEQSQNSIQQNVSFKKLYSNIEIQFQNGKKNYEEVLKLDEIHTDRSLDLKESQFLGVNETHDNTLEQIKINPKLKKDKSFLKINDVDIPKYRSIILGDSSMTNKEFQQQKQSIKQSNMTQSQQMDITKKKEINI